MKTSFLDLDGNNKKDIELPSCFTEEVRMDIVKKAFESEISSRRTPYGSYERAGKLASASGKIRHARRKWKTAYGKGISRVPRKILSRRGTQFRWVGAFASGTVGGKEAHPPKSWKNWDKKINKRERIKAIRSAIAATANYSCIEGRYKTLNSRNFSLPIIVESKLNEIIKTSELKKKIYELFKKIQPAIESIALRESKKVRAGKGKNRNRKYKISKGVLIVSSKDIPSGKGLRGLGVDIITVNKLNLRYLAPAGIPGRLTIYTEDAIDEMKKMERLR